MARLWKQYSRSRGWYDWPAGTLPDGNSVFRAGFLNQFVAWIKYLRHCETFGSFPVPEYVSIGDNIQAASFWNSLRFVPIGIVYPDFNPLLQGWGYGTNADDWKTPGKIIPDYVHALAGSEEYASHPVSEISRGDIIHPEEDGGFIRTWLANLRWRLDSCTMFHDWAPNAKSRRYTLWMKRKSDGREESRSEEAGEADWIVPVSRRSSDRNYYYSQVETYREIGIKEDKSCAGSVWFWRDPSINAPDYLPFPYPPLGSAEVLGYSATLPAVIYPGEIPTGDPFYGGEDEWAIQGQKCLFPYDTIPQAFLPPEGLP